MRDMFKITTYTLAVVAALAFVAYYVVRFFGGTGRFDKIEYSDSYHYVMLVQVHGHDYLLFTSPNGGGICHSESCSCKEAK